jgi:hypothetical protein
VLAHALFQNTNVASTEIRNIYSVGKVRNNCAPETASGRFMDKVQALFSTKTVYTPSF